LDSVRRENKNLAEEIKVINFCYNYNFIVSSIVNKYFYLMRHIHVQAREEISGNLQMEFPCTLPNTGIEVFCIFFILDI
jgi:hypothetical protein